MSGIDSQGCPFDEYGYEQLKKKEKQGSSGIESSHFPREFYLRQCVKYDEKIFVDRHADPNEIIPDKIIPWLKNRE